MFYTIYYICLEKSVEVPSSLVFELPPYTSPADTLNIILLQMIVILSY